MANSVWHTGYEIEINLSRPDLGHPHLPGLLAEVLTPTAERDPQLLECLAHHRGRQCGSEQGGKSPWMFIRRGRVGGRHPLIAAHLPITHKPTPQESEQHKALKERVCRVADRNGLDTTLEARATDGRIVTDALITGPTGNKIGWEIQLSPLSPSSVGRRTTYALNNGILPLWLTKDADATPIDRAPWTRVNDMPWRDIEDDRQMPIRGGYRRLQTWKCSPEAPRPCPDSKTNCTRYHAHWSLPALCEPEQPTPLLEELILSTAAGEHVPIFVPGRANGRNGAYMWVPRSDQDEWHTLTGETPPDATPQPEDEDDTITFDEQEIDDTCRFGEERLIRSDPRPIRDTSAHTGHRTFDPTTHLRTLTTPHKSLPTLTAGLRAAAASQHHCPPWEIGPCQGCTSPMRRYGHNAAMYCDSCRRSRNQHAATRPHSHP